MQNFKQFLEGKFNLAKADVSPNEKEQLKALAKLGWKVLQSTDFIVTSDGFEITFTNKGKVERITGKSTKDVITQATKKLGK